jgi:cellulose synthase (UDP-forming)
MWSAYNLAMIAIALLILLDVPRPDPNAWFDLRRVICLTPDAPSQPWWGITTLISEGGADVALTQLPHPTVLAVGTPLHLTIAEENLTLTGQVVRLGRQGEFPTVRVQFDPPPLAQQRRLVEMLFCRPGQWKHWDSPGELQSLGLLLKILLRPQWLARHPDVKALSVVQG